MKNKKLKTTGLVSIISMVIFVSAFAVYTSRRTDDGGASTVVGCQAGGQARIFLSDIPAYENRNQRLLLDFGASSSQTRTFTLPGTIISSGRYDVRAISSDHHFNHPSSAPDEDVIFQPDEQYYVTIDGQRAESHTTDFTDYYDWIGGDGELLRDDDNNIDTVPEVVRNTWQGESLGIIDIQNDTNEITMEHTDVYNDVVPRANSVIPSAIILNCIEERNPVLEVVKSVDADADGVFNPDQEQSKDGQTVRWKVTGRNVGDSPDDAAVITSCAPEGTTFVAGSATVTSGSQGGTLQESGGCFNWTGPLPVDGTVSIEFDVVAQDIDACDSADGMTDGRCSCIAKIYSDATDSTESNPADTDVAAVNQLQPDVSIIKSVDGSDDNDSLSDDSEQINPDGSTISWEITINNSGPGDLNNGRVVDTYPAGITLGAASATSGEVAIDGSQLVWNGSLSSGQEIVISVDSTIDDVNAFNTCESSDVPGNTAGDGLCTNRAFIGEAEDGSPTGLEGDIVFDDAEVFAVLSPSLTVKKFVDGSDADTIYSDEEAEDIVPSQPFTWRVTGCNVGDAIEPAARVVDTIPIGVVLSDEAADIRIDGTTGNADVRIDTDPESGRPVIIWSGSLDVGACVNIEYSTTIADEPSYISCREVSINVDEVCGVAAYIGKATDDSVVSVDPLTRSSDPAFVRATFASILAIEKSVDGNTDGTYNLIIEETGINETFLWKVVATNTGNTPQENARVIDSLPSGLTLVSNDPQQITTAMSGGATTAGLDVVRENDVDTVVWNGTLPVNGRVELVFMTRIDTEEALNMCHASTEGDYCRNTAKIGQADAQSQVRVIGQTDSDSADVFANPSGDLRVVKEVDVNSDGSWSDLETVNLDTSFEWRVTVHNQGDGAVENAAMLDVFPEGVMVEQIIAQPDSGTTELVAGERNYRLFWTTPSFAAGETAEFIVQAKIADLGAFRLCDEGIVDGSRDDLCTNRVYVGTGTDVDSFDDVDEDQAQVDVATVVDLYLDKPVDGTDSDRNVSDFEQVTTNAEEFEWRITFGNRGTGVAEDVTVVDPLPDGVTYVSHEIVRGGGEITYDAAKRRISWNGTIQPDSEIEIAIRNYFQNDESFRQCDIADGAEDRLCRNISRLTHEDTELEDPAFVLSGSGSPEFTISKLVDANGDGTFSETENVAGENTVVTWKAEFENTGNTTVSNLVMADDIADGLEFVNGSIQEVEGAALGVAQYKDGVVEWSGSLGQGDKVVIHFQTLVKSAIEFTQCNFSDGDANDATCTNTARLRFASSQSTIVEDSSGITTSLSVVLAYTGSRNYTTVLVGTLIAAAAIMMLIVTYVSRGRGGPGGPDKFMSSAPPPQIVTPQS